MEKLIKDFIPSTMSIQLSETVGVSRLVDTCQAAHYASHGTQCAMALSVPWHAAALTCHSCWG